MPPPKAPRHGVRLQAPPVLLQLQVRRAQAPLLLLLPPGSPLPLVLTPTLVVMLLVAAAAAVRQTVLLALIVPFPTWPGSGLRGAQTRASA